MYSLKGLKNTYSGEKQKLCFKEGNNYKIAYQQVKNDAPQSRSILNEGERACQKSN